MSFVRAQAALSLVLVIVGCSSSSSSGNGPSPSADGGGGGADGQVTADAGADAPAPPPGDAGGDASTVTLTGTPIVATAVLGTGEALLGTTADTLFNQVNGSTVFAPRKNASGQIVQTAVNQITTGWIQVETTTQLAANLAGWGLGSASLGAGSKTRYMSMRAYQIDYYEDVDLTLPTNLAPPTGVYFVSKIYFGHSYEALLSGDDTSFTAAVAANLPKASGSIQVEAQNHNLTASNVGRGLVPKGGDALFTANQADVSANYSASGPSVPIYVEYRLLPGVSEPAGTPIGWISPTKATFAIDEIDVFHNGSTLDASNTAWTIFSTCKINGAVVDDGSQVWTQSSVTAGGSTVNPDGSGPQDPNSGNATSTYGRYAGLPFSQSFPVTQGNTLECDLTGQRTDTTNPVALPPVTIQIAVDTATAVDAREGNYDTGNGLDYQVHYTVTYVTN